MHADKRAIRPTTLTQPASEASAGGPGTQVLHVEAAVESLEERVQKIVEADAVAAEDRARYGRGGAGHAFPSSTQPAQIKICRQARGRWVLWGTGGHPALHPGVGGC